MIFATRHRTASAIAGALLVGATLNVAAGEWFVVPRLALSQSYSDNVNLTPTNKQDDYISRLTPGLSVRGNGRRLDLNLDYNLQVHNYINEDQYDDINHQLQSNVDIELFRNVVFVNANAVVYQALLSNTGKITNRNFRTNENRTDVVSYSVGPTFNHHFGTWADFTASTRFTDTVGSGSGGNNSAGSGNGTNLNSKLSSGRRFTRTSWSISNRQSVFNNDSGARSNSRNWWRGTGSFDLNRFFRFNSSLGYEDNSSGGGDTDGSSVTWSVGATVTPSPRSSVTGSYGHRSFGSTKNFNFNWRRRRISISGAYSETIRTTADELQDQSLIPLEDAFGEAVFDPIAANDIDLPVDTLSLTDESFVSRNFVSTIGYYRRRDSFSVSVFRNQRDGGASGDEEEAIGTSASWSHTFSRRLSGGLRGNYRSGNANRLAGGAPSVDAGSSDVDVIFITPFVSYTIGPHTQGSLSYTYTDSSSDDISNDYSENSVSSSLSFAF